MLNRLSTLLHRAAYSLTLVALLSACSDNSSEEQTQNAAPRVNITGTSDVLEKQSVTLNANATDADGSISTYKWTQTSGPTVSIGSDTGTTLNFDLPDFDANATLIFSVTVSDNEGASSSASFTLNVERLSEMVELQGMVVDEPLANATVSFTAGDESASTTSNAEGNYSLIIEIDEKNYDELILITAIGDPTTHLGAELVSQLPTIATLKALANGEGVVDANATLGANVTNVSTAKSILITQANGNQPINQEQQLEEYTAALDTVELYELAAAIKIIIDNENYNLPDGVDNTFAYFSDADNRTAFFSNLANNAPSLLNSVIQSIVEDQDLVGDVANDTDLDDDGVENSLDAFVLDPSESVDTDGDGVGNNADTDDDNDTVLDDQDAFPLDASESVDTDGDGIGNNADTDDDNDMVLDDDDLFPLDASESADNDLDGIGNNADTDDDNDSVIDTEDAFPFDATETTDTDSDGIGNNADLDDDNDLIEDQNDGYPLIPIGDLPDADNDGIPDDCDDACQALGMQADDDDNGNGIPDDEERTSVVVTIDTPSSLITVGTSPITVSGTASSEATVYLNGVEVENNNGSFQGDVSLSEGSNSIEARAIVNDEINTDLITVSLDKTPPYLTIDSYTNNQTVYEPVIAITGLVNDIVRGTVEEAQANVTVNGVTATIKNRSYSVSDINLTQGPNQITIEASDQVGNTSTLSLVINYTALEGQKLEIVSGQNQIGGINQTLVEPLVVKVVDQSGQALADQAVVFRVTQGSGQVGVGTANQGRAVVVDTDAEGMASTNFVLGSRTGVSNHKVSASVVGITGSVNFNANAQGSLGNKLSVNSGNNQRGIVFNNLPEPFVTVVTDSGANVVEGARVRYDVLEGQGTFSNGSAQITVLTDSDGRATTQYKLGNKTGLDAQRVQATLLDAQNDSLITAGFTASAFVPALSANTTITGVVLDNQDNPIVNVTVRIEDSTREAVTDSNGQFTIEQAPVGPVHLIADGSTVTDGGEYPALSYNLVTIAGTENPLPAPIYMVKLNTENAVFAGPEDVVLEMPQFPGFKLEIERDSVTFPDGSREGLISVTSVNASKVPMAPPNGMQPQFIVTIQPSGAMFDPPARLSLPNVDAHPPGAQVEMYSYDHDLEEFVSIGLGTTSEDGSVVESNPGVGVVKAGWHCGSQPEGSGCCGGGGSGGGGCPTCNKREGANCQDGGCVPDDGQDPGDCKKCSGGAPVNDDSEIPTGPNGKCEKCEGGSPAPDASKNGSQCSTETNQSCYTCKDGKCGNNCDADPDKRTAAISSGDIAGLDSLVDKLKNAGRFLPGPLEVVAASAALTVGGSIESGEKCCQECSPGKPLKSEYNKYQGEYKIETSMKIGLRASAADLSRIIPFTVTRVVLAYEIGPFLEVKGGLGNTIAYETSDCEEGNCITVSVAGSLGAQLSVGGSLQLGYDKFDRLRCPTRNVETEAQNENTNCFGPYTGTRGELWATGGSGVKAEIAVSQCPGGDKCEIALEKVAGKIFAKATIQLDFFNYQYEDVLQEGTLFEGSSASCL